MLKHKFTSCEHEMMPARSNYFESYIRLSAARLIFISEVITKEVAAQLSALLLYYDSISSEEDITIYIHTDGGDGSALASIYDVMQMVKAPIRTVCLGKCYSAGAVMLAAGTKGKRCAFKHSKIMMHGIQCNFPIIGYDVTNSKNYLDFLKDDNDKIMKMLAKHTEQPLERVKTDCQRDTWFTPAEAKAYNLIDIIL